MRQLSRKITDRKMIMEFLSDPGAYVIKGVSFQLQPNQSLIWFHMAVSIGDMLTGIVITHEDDSNTMSPLRYHETLFSFRITNEMRMSSRENQPCKCGSLNRNRFQRKNEERSLHKEEDFHSLPKQFHRGSREWPLYRKRPAFSRSEEPVIRIRAALSKSSFINDQKCDKNMTKL